VLVPTDVAAEVIRVGRLSAHAQVCNLGTEQGENHASLMKREFQKKKWSDQQMVYINQLHLMTVMLMTGKVKVVEKGGEKDGTKDVVIEDERQDKAQTCTTEQKQAVKDKITAYVKTGPALAANAPAEGAQAAEQPAAAAAPAKQQ